MLHCLNICSGSKGNASLIYNEETLILVDVGMRKKDLLEALKFLNKKIEDIDYILITHNHDDHIKGLRFVESISDRIYLKEGILEYYFSKYKDKLHFVEDYKKYIFKTIEVLFLKTSHDVSASSGYIFKDLNSDETLGYITDNGYINEYNLDLLKNLTYYYFESNHDIYYLLVSNRTIDLKTRILSYKGHLSNEQSAIYLSYLIGEKTKKILLAHLSEECNTKDLAILTHKRIYEENNINLDNIALLTASQREMTYF